MINTPVKLAAWCAHQTDQEICLRAEQVAENLTQPSPRVITTFKVSLALVAQRCDLHQ